MSKLRHLLLIALVGSLFCSTFISAPITVAQSFKSGNLDQFTDAVIEAAFAEQRAAPFDFQLKEPTAAIQLRVIALFSGRTEVSAFSNRCAANSQTRRIVCDLRFLNSIVSDTLAFAEPIELTASDRGKSRFKNGPYRAMLRWVLAHEIGHIILNHTEGSYSDDLHNVTVFDNLQQRKELAADAFAIQLTGNLASEASMRDYGFALDVVNSLIRRKLCPKSFPNTCDKIAPGVGILFNSANQEPILLDTGGEHPELVARFVRIIYLAGIGTEHNSINYLAKQIIEQKFVIENHDGLAVSVSEIIPQ